MSIKRFQELCKTAELAWQTGAHLPKALSTETEYSVLTVRTEGALIEAPALHRID